MTLSVLILLEWEMCWTKVVEKIKIQILCPINFFENPAFIRQCQKMWWGQRGHKWPTMAHMRYMLDNQGYTRARSHALAHAPGQPHARQHTHETRRAHTRINMIYLLLFHGNKGFTNAPRCYIIRAFPVLLKNFSFLCISEKTFYSPSMVNNHWELHSRYMEFLKLKCQIYCRVGFRPASHCKSNISIWPWLKISKMKWQMHYTCTHLGEEH